MKKGDSNVRGFTIIEVALVLAIAGLIFLMVFVALPALQRQQRDTRRRESITELVSQVKKYQSNNRGALPRASGSSETDLGGNETVVYGNDSYNAASADGTNWVNFYKAYLGDNFVDPDGNNYALRVEPCGMSVDQNCAEATAGTNSLGDIYDSLFPFTYNGNKYTILIITQATCYGDQAMGTANPRKIAVLYKMEGAGVYCSNT